MNLPFSKSLSLRLLAIFVVTALLAILLLSILFSRGLGVQWRRSIQPHIVQYVNYVHNDLGTPPSIEKAKELAQNVPVQIYIYDDENNYIDSTNQQQLDLTELEFRRLPLRRAKDQVVKNTALRKSIEIAFEDDELFTLLHIKQKEHSVYYEFSGVANRGRKNHSLLLAIAAVGLVLLASFFVIRRQLNPIRKIQASVAQMSDGKLDERVEVKGVDDLAELGHSINDMAQRIQAMLESKRQLLLAISHELRSPLARARVAAEMLDDTANRERIVEDLVEMDSLIQDIMESERLQHHAVLNQQVFDLIPVVTALCEHYTPSILFSTTDQSVLVNADESRIKVMLRNLLNNAIEHGKPEGQSVTLDNDVSLSINTDKNNVLINVSDKGPGIDASAIESVSEPFFRPDTSRTRSTGGFGLGLTLAKLIAEAHEGRLTISSDPTTKPGTSISVRIPLATK